jgi:hypothetical protein
VFTDRKRKTGANSGLAQWRVTCFVETFVLYLKCVLRMNICGNNPPLRQAANRYAPLNTPAKPTHQEKFAQLK